MGLADNRFHSLDLFFEDERDRFVAELHETMEGALDTVHPVKGDQLHAQYIRKVLDLFFNIAGSDGDVV